MTIMLSTAGVLSTLSGGIALDTTVTTMGNEIYDGDSVETWRAYGVDNGVDYLSLGGFGALGSYTYTDGGSNYTEAGAPTSNADDLFFCLNATGIPNTDNTFVSIDYDGTNYLRTGASFTDGTGSCCTWRWLNINPNGPTTGNPALVVNI